MDVACNNAVDGEPPKVSVTLVSSVFVRAAGVGNCDVVANVPDVGNVTAVFPVIVPVKVNAPENAILPPIVIVEAPLLTPVPPLVPDKVPVHPAVIEVACSNAVEGVPPNVSVTLVSSALVKADAV